MKKYILLLLIAFASTHVVAQEMLDTVHVTANRAQTTLQTATRSVHVITTEDIAKSPSQTTNEVLENQSGVDVRQRGPLDVQADISIRGGTYDQTLVLINGIRMNDPQTGHHNMNLPFSLAFINQIEVLEGGASRVYGPNAFAGAINFITPEKGNNKLFATAMGGQYGLQNYSFGTAFNTGKWYSLVSGNFAKSNGYIKNTDFKNANIYGQTVGKTSLGTLLLSAGWNKKGFGAQNFYSTRYAEQFEKTQTLFGAAKLSGGETWKYTIQAYYRQHQDIFQLFRESDEYYQYNNGYFINTNLDTASYAPGSYYRGHNYHLTRVLGGEARVTRQWKKAGKTTLGFDYRGEHILSNNLGYTMDEPIDVPGQRGKYTKSDARDNYSIYVEHYFTYQKWMLTAGALGNYNSKFGYDVMPGLDLGYRIAPNAVLFASIDRSFRLPTYTDLYYSLGGARGSEDLQPEYSMNYELGYRFSNQRFGATVSVFRREGKDLIDWVEWTPDSIHAENLTTLNVNGVSLSGNYFLGEVTQNWLDKITVSYTYLTSDGTENNLPSLYVLDFLTHKLTFGLQHSALKKKLSFAWQLSYQERSGTFTNTSGTQQNYTPFWLFDGKVSFALLEKVDVFVAAHNMFNTTYIDRGNIMQPGIWVSGGVKFQLEKNQ